jgi:hypothetical protein
VGGTGGKIRGRLYTISRKPEGEDWLTLGKILKMPL